MKKTLVLLCGLTAATGCVGDFFELDQCLFAYNIRPTPARDLMTLVTGDSVALTASREPGCQESWPVTWSLDPSGIATVRATGDSTAMLRAVAAGTATVNVTKGDRSGFTIVTVRTP